MWSLERRVVQSLSFPPQGSGSASFSGLDARSRQRREKRWVDLGGFARSLHHDSAHHPMEKCVIPFTLWFELCRGRCLLRRAIRQSIKLQALECLFWALIICLSFPRLLTALGSEVTTNECPSSETAAGCDTHTVRLLFGENQQVDSFLISLPLASRSLISDHGRDEGRSTDERRVGPFATTEVSPRGG